MPSIPFATTTPNVKFTIHGRPFVQLPFSKLAVGEAILCYEFPLKAVTQAIDNAHRRRLERFELSSAPPSGNDFYITKVA